MNAVMTGARGAAVAGVFAWPPMAGCCPSGLMTASFQTKGCSESLVEVARCEAGFGDRLSGGTSVSIGAPVNELARPVTMTAELSRLGVESTVACATRTTRDRGTPPHSEDQDRCRVTRSGLGSAVRPTRL